MFPVFNRLSVLSSISIKKLLVKTFVVTCLQPRFLCYYISFASRQFYAVYKALHTRVIRNKLCIYIMVSKATLWSLSRVFMDQWGPERVYDKWIIINFDKKEYIDKGSGKFSDFFLKPFKRDDLQSLITLLIRAPSKFPEEYAKNGLQPFETSLLHSFRSWAQAFIDYSLWLSGHIDAATEADLPDYLARSIEKSSNNWTTLIPSAWRRQASIYAI